MPDRPLVSEVVAKLQTYGSADQIAQFFEREGVVGRVGEPYLCPVARYVFRETARPVCAAQQVISCQDESVELSQGDPVGAFIDEFDAGRYPQLEVHLP